MLPVNRNKFLKDTLYYLAFFVFIYLFFIPAYAQLPGPININRYDAGTIIKNIAEQMPAFMRMVSAISYVMGMYFIFLAIVKLRAYGEARTMMSQEHSLKAPLIFMTVGAFLIYIPTSVQVGLSTFWSSPNPYGYLQEKDSWGELMKDLYLIVQFIGIVAFIRGLVIMTHLAGHGGQPGTFAKGMTHIIGGIFCLNMYQFIQTVWVTLFGNST